MAGLVSSPPKASTKNSSNLLQLEAACDPLQTSFVKDIRINKSEIYRVFGMSSARIVSLVAGLH